MSCSILRCVGLSILALAIHQVALGENLLIKGGTVVTAEGSRVVDVRIRGERIFEIGNLEPTPTDQQIIDATNMLVLPGGIDSHVHLVAEPGPNTFVDDFTSGSRAALAGGITTLGHMAFPIDGELPLATLQREKKAIEAQVLADVFVHLTIFDLSNAAIDQLPELASLGQPSVKVFMPFPQFESQVTGFMQLLTAAKDAGVVVAIHCEDFATVNHVADELTKLGHTSLAYYADSRPAIAEEIATHRAVGMAEVTGATIYIVHLSAEGALSATEASRNSGQVFVETRPLYLHLTAEQYARTDRGLFVGMPPLRSMSDQNALWEGLANGTIDTIATDHAPWMRTQKLDSNQTIAVFRAGVNNLQVMLPMLFSEGVNKGRLSIERFVEVTSTNPAKIFGMYPRKGTIAVGSDADIALWDPDEVHEIADADVLSNAGFSIYSGTEVVGWPKVTIRRGEVVFRNGRVLATPGSGKLVSRSPMN